MTHAAVHAAHNSKSLSAPPESIGPMGYRPTTAKSARECRRIREQRWREVFDVSERSRAPGLGRQKTGNSRGQFERARNGLGTPYRRYRQRTGPLQRIARTNAVQDLRI